MLRYARHDHLTIVEINDSWKGELDDRRWKEFIPSFNRAKKTMEGLESSAVIRAIPNAVVRLGYRHSWMSGTTREQTLKAQVNIVELVLSSSRTT